MTLALTETELSKTQLGVVSSFEELFTDVKRSPIDQTARVRGKPHYPAGCVFLATDRHGPQPLPACIDPAGKWMLTCKPALQLPKFSPCPAPRDGWPWVMRPCETIRVIPWVKHEHYLVIACNPTHLRDHWLAFVPFSAKFPFSE